MYLQCIVFSGFVGPINHHQYYEENKEIWVENENHDHEKNKKLDDNEKYEKIKKMVENEFFSIILKAKVEEILSDVSNIIQEKTSYGTFDLNRLRLV